MISAFPCLGRLMLGVLLLAPLTACDSETVKVLQSPCAALEGGACGPKRAVNDWWRHPDAVPEVAADHV